MKRLILSICLLTISLLLLAIPLMAVDLTESERAYLEVKGPIRVAFSDGSAPLSYVDSDGSLQGINMAVFDLVAERAGFAYTPVLVTSAEEARALNADMGIGIDSAYASPGVLLSTPYLSTTTILVTRSDVDITDLDSRIYAGVRSDPRGKAMDPSKVRFFATREATLQAVNNKKADYTYANAYSASYYIIRDDLHNLLTIPRAIDSRAYSFGVLNNDEVLLGILNKTLASIDPAEIQTLVLAHSSTVQPKVTFNRILSSYGVSIFIFWTMLIIGLSLITRSAVLANRRLSEQNRRSLALSKISNEYLFEYIALTDTLHLGQRSKEFFDATGNIRDLIKEAIFSTETVPSTPFLELTLHDGTHGFFRLSYLTITNKSGKVESVMGKLIDITDEVHERDELLNQLKSDDLTKLYNASTSKGLIGERLHTNGSDKTDAFLVIDVDSFKAINDTYGHLVGDEILIGVAESLRRAFRSSDIIARIGGDEFSAYLKDVRNLEFVQERCRLLEGYVNEIREDINVTVSMGVTIAQGNDDYETLFRRADEALYEAKEKREAGIYYATR